MGLFRMNILEMAPSEVPMTQKYQKYSKKDV